MPTPWLDNQSALQDAQSLAVGRDHQFIEPVHLMEALLEQLVIDPRGSVVVLAAPADPSFMTVASEFAQDAWGISSGSRFR